MSEDEYLSVARVIKTHGLKGEVAVAESIATSLSLLENVVVWFVPPPAGVRTATVSAVRPGPKGPLISFAEVRDVDTAALLVGCEILAYSSDVPEQTAEPVDDDHDFHGYEVTDSKHGYLGAISETIITGANDVWVVHGPLGEVLIPVIDQVVEDVDHSSCKVAVTLLDGLLPEGSDS